VARENLPLARLKNGSPVPPETPEERAQPIVPHALEVQTIDRALLSAAMRCSPSGPCARSRASILA
jgi:hypothetical protein